MARRKYKFTEKTHSIRAVIAIAFSVASMVIFGITVGNSVEHAGSGSVYLGAAGLLSMFAAAAGFYFAVKAVREEDTFRLLPMTGMIISVVSCLVWIGIYVIGFVL